MDELRLERLVRLRGFPPVVHPRHAREALADGDAAAWTGGYAITVPEHRALLEELLGRLAWKETGGAVLVNGLYGAGKSHLLVLLHLLTAREETWTPFLEAHPAFRRYASAVPHRRWLPVHFTLDDYRPGTPLEHAVGREIARALAEAGLTWEADAPARGEAWAALVATLRTAGYFGLLLLVDELSLFLAGRAPAQREADAAFLQFLAGWTGRAPVWLVGTLQRALADVGPLRTHSWRQVEDRFRRFTLSPQQLGDVLRQKLFLREDPAGIRALVAECLLPAAEAARLPLTAGELHAAYPFHPAALDLLLAVVNGHLSPHRGAVETLQRLAGDALPDRPATRLFTPLDLFDALRDDLRREERLAKLWAAADALAGLAETPTAARAVDLLTLLHLAGRTLPVAALRGLLFDGTTAPETLALSRALHELRRRGAYLAVVRDADPGAELFSLAVDDDAGALALARMGECRQEFIAGDPRVTELALQACTDDAWPLAAALDGVRVEVPWQGTVRAVQVTALPAVTEAHVAAAYQSLAAGQAEAAVLFPWPGMDAAACWRRATAGLDDAGTLLLWQARTLTPEERALWEEYAAWARAAADPNPPASPRERKALQRCRERAAELQPAVAASVRAVYREGAWLDGAGNEGRPPDGALAAGLGEILDTGLLRRFPLLPLLAPHGAPPRAAAVQMVNGFLDPGEATLPPQSLLADYLERYAAPLGWAVISAGRARVAPPRWEALEPVLAAEAPLRLADAMARLARPPLGLPAETARLTLLAAVRSGALQGLDAFLQPLPDEVPLARGDAVAFLAPPETVPEALRPRVAALAARWAVPLDPWPVACSGTARRLAAWLRDAHGRLAETRAALAGWSAALEVEPWGWRRAEALGVLLDDAEARTFPERLLVFDAAVLDEVDALLAAARWWRREAPRTALLALPQPTALAAEATALHAALAAGEGCLPQLDDLGTRLTAFAEGYLAAYRRWHDACFGAAVVAGLREAFERPAFRAVKALARLPLPLPDPATRALAALASARNGYCAGTPTPAAPCPRCGRALGSPSPLPDPVAVARDADAALADYAALLRTHPWAAATRARLPRAPEAVATRAAALLAWAPDAPLPLDDVLLAWLCRDAPASGTRQVAHLHGTLAAHDLTLAEARTTVAAWLDPENALGDDAVLAFE